MLMFYSNRGLELQERRLVVRSNIGRLIKVRRSMLGLTQRDLAERVGVTSSAVSLWETGSTQNIEAFRMERLAEALQINVDELLHPAAPIAAAVTESASELADFIRSKKTEGLMEAQIALMDAVARCVVNSTLSTEQLRAVTGMIEAMSKS
jgi:transcriptional regulator with XRE-family HTH domain